MDEWKLRFKDDIYIYIYICVCVVKVVKVLFTCIDGIDSWQKEKSM